MNKLVSMDSETSMQTTTEQGAITITAGEMDGIRHPDPAVAECVYLDLRLHFGPGKYDYDCVSGWVRPNAAALLKAAPGLLALARKYASECAECGGTGLLTIKTWPGGIEVDNDDQSCADCADIRAVIAKATGAA